MSFVCHGCGQFVVHLLGGDIFGNIHLRVSFANNMIHRYTAAQEFFLQHLKNGGLPAASDTSQYLDKRLVDKRLNGLNIIRSVDHRIASLTVVSITEITAIFNKFLRFNKKNF